MDMNLANDSLQPLLNLKERLRSMDLHIPIQAKETSTQGDSAHSKENQWTILKKYWDLSSDYICIVDKGLEVITCNSTIQERLSVSPGSNFHNTVTLESAFLLKSELSQVFEMDKISELGSSCRQFLWALKNESGLIFDRWEVKVIQVEPEKYLLVGPSIQTSTLLHEQLSMEVEMSNMTSKLASLGEMCAGVMHEISSPIMIIQGYANQIKKYSSTDKLTPTKLMYLGEKIEESTLRVSKIVKSMRSLTRNSGFDNFETFDINNAIEESLIVCRDKFKQNDIVVLWERQEPINIHGDSTQVSQVLLNLLSNSLDAVKDLNDRWVSISLKILDETVRLELTDSGLGIPEHLRKNIFQTFYTTKSKGEGTGLGLAISQRIIKKHRGQLYLGNHSLHTQFIVDLPLT